VESSRDYVLPLYFGISKSDLPMGFYPETYQDSEEEWIVEREKMALEYNRAYVRDDIFF